MANLSDLLPLALQAGSTVLSASSQVARGRAGSVIAAKRKALSNFEADQLEQSGVESRGVGMRGAADAALKTNQVNSETLARAAASGAGASDPTVMNIIARTAGEGSYRQALAMYEGEAQARLDVLRASGLRYQGQNYENDANAAAGQSNISALNTVLSGGDKMLSMYEKYWAGPRATSAGQAAPQNPATFMPAGYLDAGTTPNGGAA